MRRIVTLALFVTCLAPVLAQERERHDQADDVESGRPRLVLETGGHTARIMNVFFTPDSKQLVSISRDAALRFWDASSGELRRTLHLQCHQYLEGGPQNALLTNDSKTLVLNGGGRLKM